MKRLIVNADDFGMAQSVNDGIIKGHQDGIITSTSFMAGAKAAEHAAELAKDNPSLGVGIHLCLTLIRPVSAPANLPTLAPEGFLPGGPFSLMARLMSGRIKKREIESELRAQIERTLAFGIMPDHIDGHQHVHMMPGVFDIALKLAKEYRIPAMRYPVGPIASFSLSPSPSAGEGRPKAGVGVIQRQVVATPIPRTCAPRRPPERRRLPPSPPALEAFPGNLPRRICPWSMSS